MSEGAEYREPHQEVIWTAIPTKHIDDLVAAVGDQLKDPHLTRRKAYRDMAGVITHFSMVPEPHFNEVDLRFDREVIVRISDTEVTSTESVVLANLVEQGLARSVVFSFAFSPSFKIREILEGTKRSVSGHKIIGTVLRNNNDFYAHRFEGRPDKNRFMYPLVLQAIDEDGLKMLSFHVQRDSESGKESLQFDWDGRVVVKSDEGVLTGVEAIDRYTRIKKAFGIEMVPYSDRVLIGRGFSRNLRDLYKDKNELLNLAAA